MARRTLPRIYGTSQMLAALGKLNTACVDGGQLPLHYALEQEMLVLRGANNLGKPDEQNLFRLDEGGIGYGGPIDVRGHITNLTLRSSGETGDIRVTGYVTGESALNPSYILSEDAMVVLGDGNVEHGERKLIVFAHIEAASGISIYKRQLLDTVLVNHAGDTIIRGQIVQQTDIQTPGLNMNVSLCRDSTLNSVGDALLKGSEFSGCAIHAADGDVYLCAGHIRQCTIEAQYDIELNGSVDAYTLQHTRSHKGVVRHDGQVISTAKKTKSAPGSAARGTEKLRRRA